MIRRLAAALGWPVLADPRSGIRAPGEPGAPTVAAADALLRVEAFAHEQVPEIVLRLGEPWASKAVAGWLSASAAAGAVQVLVDPYWAWRDPGREADVVMAADPDYVLEALLLRMPEGGGPGRSAWASPTSWAAAWAQAEASAQRAIDGVLSRHGEATEPGVGAGLVRLVTARLDPCRLFLDARA